MEVVSSGAQYRQDPYLWGTDLSPGGAKENEDCLQREIWPLGSTLDGKALPKIGFSTVSLARPFQHRSL